MEHGIMWSLERLSVAEQLELQRPLDVHALDLEEGNLLLDGVQEVQRNQARDAADLFARVDRFRRRREESVAGRADRGGMFARSLRAELAAALRMPERTVETLMARARIFADTLPATLAFLSAGRISERHAVIIADESVRLTDEQAHEFEEQALPEAERLRAGLFEKHARQLSEAIGAQDLAERHEDARRRREVTVEPGRDGMGWLTAHLPNPELIAIGNRLTRIARSLQVEGEERTLPQLRADALVDILTDDGTLLPPGKSETELRTPTKHRGIRAEVSLVVPALTVMGKDVTPGMLEGQVPVDAETARELAGTSTGFTRILTHPETGVTLSFGRTRYQVPAELRRYLKYRDGTCRFPGCGNPAEFCDIDHTVPWADDGPTDHHNLANLCTGHHTTKHADWDVQQARDGTGTLTWTSPLGRIYVTRPAHNVTGVTGNGLTGSGFTGSGFTGSRFTDSGTPERRVVSFDDPPPF